MGKSFVYNTGSSDDDIKGDELRLKFGIFIDGTLNNMYNTDLRTKHSRGGDKGKPDTDLTNTEIEANDKNAYDALPKERKKRIEELLKKENRDLHEQKELELYPEKEVYLAASHRAMMDKMGTDNSYSNDYTNVARMWTCCEKKQYAIYIEGMGTRKANRDDDDGFQFGAGKISGIRARVREACEKLADKIGEQQNKEDKKVTQITLDVFGFSRGAASARNFVSEVNFNRGIYAATKAGEYEYKDPDKRDSKEYEKTKDAIPQNHRSIDGGLPSFSTNGIKDPVKKKDIRPIYHDRDGQLVNADYIVNGKMPRFGHLGISLLEKGIVQSLKELEDITIIVRFLGIYDTVSSYGEIDEMGGDDVYAKGVTHLVNSFFTNDEEELNLQNMGGIQKIVHFTAKDEHRENFALTRVDKSYSRENEDGSNRLVERNLPGVHCDIGGAYLNEPEIVDEIETTAFLTLKTALTASKELSNLRQVLIDNYWFTEKQIQITTPFWYYPAKVIERFSRMSGRFRTAYLARQAAYEALSSERNVRKEYSYIPLHFMEDYFRVYIEDKYMPDNLEDYYSISNFPVLEQAKAYLKNHVLKDNKEWEFINDRDLIALKNKKDIKLKEQQTTAKDNIPSNQPKFDYEKDQAYERDQKHSYEERIKSELESRKTYLQKEGEYNNPEDEIKTPHVYAWEDNYPAIETAEAEIHYNSQALLRKLRNEYFHWSSNRDWFGMDHAKNRIRDEYPKS